ncbi:MAG: alcohol acetyltransferase [Eubacteriales bacterium]|nr:alcohol acetyltransferase [Eubacteriales bacterium]
MNREAETREMKRMSLGIRRRKLDNVALAFPAATGKADSRVFRICCRLQEQVDKTVLQEALLETIKRYPIFNSVLRRGNFWYYFEKSKTQPVVVDEKPVPCSPLYEAGSEKMLYQVSCRENRINLEVFHALTDGTGAIEFLTEIVKDYLWKKHGIEMAEAETAGEAGGAAAGGPAAFAAQEEDSFQRYYSPEKQEKRSRKSEPAYQIGGRRVGQEEMRILECTLSVQELLKKARACGVSITEYLSAVLMQAIAESERYQKRWGKKRAGLFSSVRGVRSAAQIRSGQTEKPPVTLMIPVNLRKYYPSKSLSNFFGLMEIEYGFPEGASFADLLAHVKKRFTEDLTKGQVAARMNGFVRIEKNPLMHIIPLPVKDFFLKIGTTLGGRNVTAVFSNMSIISLPDCYTPYIEGFGAIASTDKLQMCACSYQDSFYISITSKYRRTDIPAKVLEILRREGLTVSVRNENYTGVSPFSWMAEKLKSKTRPDVFRK